MLDGALPFTPGLAAAWLAPAIVAAITIVAMQDRARYKRRRLTIADRVLLFVYLIAIAAVMLWPLELRVSAEALRDGNWIPLRGALGFFLSGDPIRAYLGQLDVVAHILLFAPIGLLFPFVFERRHGVFAVVMVAAYAFGIEVLQGLTVPDRVFDIDQAIAGAIGGAMAAVAVSGLRLFSRLGRLATQ